MVGLEPQLKDGGRYTQAEALRILEISKPTFWKYRDNALVPDRMKKGREKRYYGREIKKIWKVNI